VPSTDRLMCLRVSSIRDPDILMGSAYLVVASLHPASLAVEGKAFRTSTKAPTDSLQASAATIASDIRERSSWSSYVSDPIKVNAVSRTAVMTRPRRTCLPIPGRGPDRLFWGVVVC
jgi:hypothetical protein